MKRLIFYAAATALIVFIGVVASIAIFGPPLRPCEFGPCILR